MTNGTRRGRGFNVTPRPLFTPGKDLVPIVQEAGWAPGPVWTGAENLAPLRFDPWTVQPVASHYTDSVIQPTPCVITHGNAIFIFTNTKLSNLIISIVFNTYYRRHNIPLSLGMTSPLQMLPSWHKLEWWQAEQTRVTWYVHRQAMYWYLWQPEPLIFHQVLKYKQINSICRLLFQKKKKKKKVTSSCMFSKFCKTNSKHSWFQTFAVFWMLYALFWVIPRHMNFICQCFGTFCLSHLNRQVGVEWLGLRNVGLFMRKKVWFENSLSQQTIVQPKGLCRWKISVIPLWIETAVAQCLNSCATGRIYVRT